MICAGTQDGTQNEAGTQTASPPNLASQHKPLEINSGDAEDARNAKFPAFSDSRDGGEEPDYGEI